MNSTPPAAPGRRPYTFDRVVRLVLSALGVIVIQSITVRVGAWQHSGRHGTRRLLDQKAARRKLTSRQVG